MFSGNRWHLRSSIIWISSQLLARIVHFVVYNYLFITSAIIKNMKNDPVFNEKKKKNTVESETEPSIMNNMIEKVDQEILKKSSTNIFEACITEIKKSNKCNISIFVFLTLTFCFFLLYLYNKQKFILFFTIL